MQQISGSAWDAGEARRIIDRHKDRPGALLPILHAIQDHFAYVPEAAMPMIAETLGITRAEVHGVVSFYHHFRSREPGCHVIEICRAEACQAQGGRALEAHAKKVLGVDYDQTTRDNRVSLEAVYCLGNCSCGPSVRIGADVHARVDAKRLDALLDELLTEPLTLANDTAEVPS